MTDKYLSFMLKLVNAKILLNLLSNTLSNAFIIVTVMQYSYDYIKLTIEKLSLQIFYLSRFLG